MIPSAKTVNAKRPAIGRIASAACAEISIVVVPWLWSVAAAVMTINNATTLETPMPKIGVDPHAVQFGRSLLGGDLERTGGWLLSLGLDLLASLPEKQVRADRRAQDRNDGGERLA